MLTIPTNGYFNESRENVKKHTIASTTAEWKVQFNNNKILQKKHSKQGGEWCDFYVPKTVV